MNWHKCAALDSQQANQFLISRISWPRRRLLAQRYAGQPLQVQSNATCVKLQTAHKVNTAAWRDIPHPPLHIWQETIQPYNITRCIFPIPASYSASQNSTHAFTYFFSEKAFLLLIFCLEIQACSLTGITLFLVPERDGESMHIKAISYCYSPQLTLKFCSRHVKRAHQLNSFRETSPLCRNEP